MARNPVIVRFSGDEGTSVNYKIYEGQSELYAGQLSVPAGGVEVDFSFLFTDLHEHAGVRNYTLEADDGSSAPEYSFSVYGGGVSKMYRREAVDVFSEKLKNVYSNFFLSTRTGGKVLRIAENELMPLFFYGGNMEFEVRANGTVLAKYDGYTSDADELMYIDLQELRSSAVAYYGMLPSVLEVVPAGDNSPCCVIVVTEGEPTEHYIEFTNSYGCKERLALYGVVEFIPEYEERQTVLRYNGKVQDYSRVAERGNYTLTYKARSGYRATMERLFVMDMLCSAECTFVCDGHRHAALVTGESQTLESTAGQALSVELLIELLDKDSDYSPADLLRADFRAERKLTDAEGGELCDNHGRLLFSRALTNEQTN